MKWKVYYFLVCDSRTAQLSVTHPWNLYNLIVLKSSLHPTKLKLYPNKILSSPEVESNLTMFLKITWFHLLYHSHHDILPLFLLVKILELWLILRCISDQKRKKSISKAKWIFASYWLPLLVYFLLFTLILERNNMKLEHW